MPENNLSSDSFSPDILEFLRKLHKYKVKYLIVGGQAVIYHGYARLTGDVDVFYRLDEKNISALFQGLDEFWGGDIPGIESQTQLGIHGRIIQFGVPPNRIDLINDIDGVSFDSAWSDKLSVSVDHPDNPVSIYIISLKNLIRNKSHANRPKDIDDLRFLKKKS